MDTFAEMIEAVQDDLTLSDSSSFATPALVKRALNRAKYKVEGLFRWPKLEDSKKVTMPKESEYIDTPDNWRPDSTWKLTVNDQDYGKPLSFKSFLYEKENSWPSGKDYSWAKQWSRIFAKPTFVQGDVVTIWGMKNAPKLVVDGDTTIFSYTMPEVNEAIVLEAKEILKAKGDDVSTNEMLSAEANAIIGVAWTRIKQDGATEEQTQPMLDVSDMFSGRRGGKDTNYGKF